MTQPYEITSVESHEDSPNLYKKVSIFISIGVLAAAGILVIAFILTGAAGDMVFRAFMSLLLVTMFSFAVMAESSFSEKRTHWVTTTRIGLLVATLAAGMWHIWAPLQLDGYTSNYNVEYGQIVERVSLFFVTVIVLQLAALAVSILGQRLSVTRLQGVFVLALIAGIFAFVGTMILFAVGFTLPYTINNLSGFWKISVSLFVASVVLILIAIIGRMLYLQPQKPLAIVRTLTTPGGFHRELEEVNHHASQASDEGVNHIASEDVALNAQEASVIIFSKTSLRVEQLRAA